MTISASMQNAIDAAFQIVQVAQGSYNVTESDNGFEAYTNALNLTATIAGQSPLAVGLNLAATANNTTAMLDKFMSNQLQPSDVLEVTSSALSLVLAAAAISGTSIGLPALALAGTVAIVAGPGALRENFNDYAKQIGDMLSQNSFFDYPVNINDVRQGIGEDVNSSSIIVRQYDIGNSEIISFEHIGINSEVGQIVKISGETNVLTLRPGGDQLIDTSQATLVSEFSVQISDSQAESLSSFFSNNMNYYGNSADFAMDAFGAMGIGYSSYSGYFSSTSLSYQYMQATNTLYQPVEYWEGLWMYTDADLEADGWLRTRNAIENKIGRSKDHDEIAWAVQSGLGSPIVIDLDFDGINTIDIKNSGIYFDVTGDGIKERTGWLSGGDAFVVIDANNNGKIDDVNEMFGGLDRGEGYAELSAFDGNGNGFIDQQDDGYFILNIWQDKNANAETDEGELKSLGDVGIDFISTEYSVVDAFDSNRNFIGETSFASINNMKTTVSDIYFRFSNLANLDGRSVASDAKYSLINASNKVAEYMAVQAPSNISSSEFLTPQISTILPTASLS
jgi:hypothetical protein